MLFASSVEFCGWWACTVVIAVRLAKEREAKSAFPHGLQGPMRLRDAHVNISALTDSALGGSDNDGRFVFVHLFAGLDADG